MSQNQNKTFSATAPQAGMFPATDTIVRAMINGLAHVWLSLQGGVEEAKERFRDAESEIRSARGK